jgi:hypothetical protein
VGFHDSQEVPAGVSGLGCHRACMTRVNCRLVDTIYEALPACEVAQIDAGQHMIGGYCGTSCLVASADWSLPFFMPSGVDSWQTRGTFRSDDPH